VKIVVARVNQAQRFRLFAHADFVPRPGDYMVLAVAGHVGFNQIGVDDKQFDFAVAVDHYRAAAQCVRVERHQHYSVELGVHNGPPAAQGISGGASGGGNEQAVGALAIDELVVDIQLKIDHADKFAGVHDNIVERVVSPYG